MFATGTPITVPFVNTMTNCFRASLKRTVIALRPCFRSVTERARAAGICARISASVSALSAPSDARVDRFLVSARVMNLQPPFATERHVIVHQPHSRDNVAIFHAAYFSQTHGLPRLSRKSRLPKTDQHFTCPRTLSEQHVHVCGSVLSRRIQDEYAKGTARDNDRHRIIPSGLGFAIRRVQGADVADRRGNPDPTGSDAAARTEGSRPSSKRCVDASSLSPESAATRGETITYDRDGLRHLLSRNVSLDPRPCACLLDRHGDHQHTRIAPLL